LSDVHIGVDGIGFAAGAHTITNRVTGMWNPAGCCRWVVMDAFDVM
jgi:hypothetical protein